MFSWPIRHTVHGTFSCQDITSNMNNIDMVKMYTQVYMRFSYSVLFSHLDEAVAVDHCSGHGFYNNGVCTCHHLWVGEKCQYRGKIRCDHQVEGVLTLVAGGHFTQGGAGGGQTFYYTCILLINFQIIIEVCPEPLLIYATQAKLKCVKDELKNN